MVKQASEKQTQIIDVQLSGVIFTTKPDRGGDIGRYQFHLGCLDTHVAKYTGPKRNTT